MIQDKLDKLMDCSSLLLLLHYTKYKKYYILKLIWN